MDNDLKLMIGEDESIMYAGKPNKKCFIFESIFNPLLPFALVWGIIDFGVIGFSMSSKEEGIAFFMIHFMLLHLMPVWIYLGGVLLTFRRYRNTFYIVTDKAIYTSEGAFSKRYRTKPFAELSHVDLHRGIFDQWFNVGDIVTTSSQVGTITAGGTARASASAGITINSISNYIEVYNIVKKLQQDIYTDVMYPNDLRPKSNHGYNTKYRG